MVSVKHVLTLALLLAACQSTPPETPEEARAVEERQLLAQPGPEHAFLDDLVGEFDARLKVWMGPGPPRATYRGQMRNEWILGGRFVEGTFTGEVNDEPFEAVSLVGYDNAQQVYHATWLDTNSTAMLPISRGRRVEDEIHFTREMIDIGTGESTLQRELLTIESSDRHTVEMFIGLPDGSLLRTTEITYTRRKEQPEQ